MHYASLSVSLDWRLKVSGLNATTVKLRDLLLLGLVQIDLKGLN
ncbi:MAG: hypothetical protein ACI9FG_001692 [Crocinitomicaceae bacterium]|jgi:hypothetical protein